MANALIVHDDSVISRVAHLLEDRKRNISRYEAILSGDDKSYENYNVNQDAVRQALEAERWLLSDLIEDIEVGLFERELKDIRAMYCMGGADGGKQI